MERGKASDAHFIHTTLEKVNGKRQKLHNIKDQIVEILEGYDWLIPEEAVFKAFREIENLKKYLDKDIEKLNKQIDEL